MTLPVDVTLLVGLTMMLMSAGAMFDYRARANSFKGLTSKRSEFHEPIVEVL
jgi:hypothetical protein